MRRPLEAPLLDDLYSRAFTLDGEAVDVLEFIEVNHFGIGDIEEIHSLAVGEKLVYGGGAWAEFVLRRTR
jgi:hypothetical protein